ncbi:uncharacterized protein BHQ10_001066 [Talaromyces amestolkiae]|uniref:Major facilitator superfamily (MFS) profile domain-containing protein n=1 Tax=Talaromyces amestolkiae TaxID=1196081 RepID=A0A364KNC7_TALAM|nr:uncharacterized protein BHQ10_001066 [Talaromyces amestolkiae]RAO65054.1 hypothetical protein BHQ10_001066 [Talaromyces amestolkiae]
MIVPIVPYTLEERVGVDDADVLKWTSIFLAVFGFTNVISSPLIGLLADKFPSRRILFTFGLLVMAISTALYWIGTTIFMLVAARALQGLSATAVWVVGMAIINDVSGPDDLGISMSYVWSANTLGLLCGPIIGGTLFQFAGYHSVFAVAIGLLGVDTVLRLLMAEISNEDVSPSSNIVRAVDTEGELREENPLLQAPVAAKHSYNDWNMNPVPENEPTADPSLRVRSAFSILLCYPRTATIVVASIMNAGILSSFETVLPLYLVQLFHIDSARVGLFFLSLSGSTLLSPTFGKIADKYGTKWITVISTICVGGAILMMSLVNRNTTFHQSLLYVLLFFCGIGRTGQRVGMSTDTGLALRALVEEPGVVDQQLTVAGITGQAYGLLSTACGIGVTLGPLLRSLTLSLAVPSAMYTGGDLRRKKEKQALVGV